MISTIRLLVAAAALGCGLAGQTRADEAYRLGPQDQLQLKVSDLRAGTGEAYQWQAFTGEFIVAASGRVSLPVIGEVQASGRTTTDVAAEISNRLQAKAGLATKPDASVQVIRFRPFYVMGVVEKPGEYEYRPQLNVLQAVSMAGGLQRLSNDALLGFVREALVSRGDIEELSASRFALIARQARLDAEIDRRALSFPRELQSRAKEPEVERAMREERLAFETRASALASQTANLTQTKLFLQEQISSLTAKDVNSDKQITLMKQELTRISTLVDKGLAAVPREIDARQTIAQLESNRIDAQIAIIRARQDVSKADRDILDLTDTMRTTALQEAAETRIKLNEVQTKLEAANNLLYQAEMRSPTAVLANSDAYAKPDYFILRRAEGKSETIAVSEDDPVLPGDVVRVQPKQPPASVPRATDSTRFQQELTVDRRNDFSTAR